MNEGYIKLYRKILENPVFVKDSDYIKVWIYILLSATHKERKTIFGKETILLKPGQLITGREKISLETNIEPSKVERILKWLKIEQQIEQQTNSKGRLISVCNWEQYQINEQQIEQQVNNECTTNEQRVNTNKNDKNVKNDKNIYSVVEENLQMALSPMNYEKINYLVETYGEDKVIDAIKKSANANKKSLNYVEGILKNKNFTKEAKVPGWTNEKFEREEMSPEEVEEMENLFKEFK